MEPDTTRTRRSIWQHPQERRVANPLLYILITLFGGAFLAMLYRQFDNTDKNVTELRATMIRLFAEQKAEMIRLFAEQKADTETRFDKLEAKLAEHTKPEKVGN
jgi:hypothetical protein